MLNYFYRILFTATSVIFVSFVSSANAALPTLAQLVGTWQTAQGQSFQINTEGNISGLILNITDSTTPNRFGSFPVKIDGYTINTGVETTETSDDNTIDIEGYPVSGGILNGSTTGQTAQDCGLNPTNFPNGKCHIRIGATFNSNQTVTFSHKVDDAFDANDPLDTDGADAFNANVYSSYSWVSNTGSANPVNPEEVQVVGNITTATHGTPAAVLSLSPTSLSFGNQTVNTTSVVRPVILKNEGTVAATGISIGAITGTNASEFTKTTTCGTTLAAAATCNISVTFKPTAIGNRTATYTVTSNATAVSATLTGFGINTPTPSLGLEPDSLNFGDQTVNTNTVRTVTVSNTGTATATGISIGAITGTNASEFTKTTTCGTTLAAAATCNISVTFKPTAIGNRTATFTVTSNAATVSATLTGTGTSPSALSLSSASLSFANQTVTVGTTSAARSLTLTNNGAVAITGISITITGNAANDYARSGGTCTTTLAAAPASCTIGITFTPTVVGTRAASLNVGSSAGVKTATLTGIGTAVTPPTPPPAAVTTVPVLDPLGLGILAMLLTGVVGVSGKRKKD